MIYDTFHEIFLCALYSKIPNRKVLADFISSSLHIDKRAVNRRLQGDHQFRINEVLQVCSLLDISIDQLIPTKLPHYEPPSIIYCPFGNVSENELISIHYWLDKYKSALSEKDSYVLMSCNILPDIFSFQYENLTRFYKLKWAYYMTDDPCSGSVDEDFVLQTSHLSAVREYIKTVFQFPKLLIIWDYNIIPSIIKDIEYFTQIGCLTREHRSRLKEELLLIVDRIDNLCKEFTTPQDAGNFTFAISSTFLTKTHSVFKGADFKIAVDSAFYTTYLHVSDARVVESVEHIILATLKSSVIISHSNDSQRTKFIDQQKALVESIK